MNVLDNSLSYRATTWFAGRAVVACRDSLAGRFFVAVSGGVRRVCSASAAFGLRRAASRPVARDGHPWTVTLITRPYLRLRGACAPVAEIGRAGVRTSRFASGNWLAVAASGVFALGCGLLVGEVAAPAEAPGDGSGAGVPGLSFVLPALLLLMGALAAAAAAGPGAASALRFSGVFRGARRLGRALGEGPPPRRMQDDPASTAATAATAATATATAATATASAGPVRGPASAPATDLGRGRSKRDLWLWSAMALAVVAGLLGGLSPHPGPVVVVAAGAAVIGAAVVFRRPEVLFLPAAAFPWVDWAARRSLGGFGAAWDEAFLLLSIGLVVWSVLFLRRATLRTVPILLPLLLAFVAAVGSVVVNAVPGDVALFALRVLFQPLIFYFVGFLLPMSRKWVQWTVAVFVLSGVAMALHGLYQYVTEAPMPASWIDAREWDIATRAFSIVENPNGLGAFLLMGALLTLSLALRSGLPTLQRWAMASACVVQAAGVAVTFSRGAWLGLVAGALALLIMSYRRYLVPLMAAGVVGWFAMPPAFTNRLTFAFSAAYVAKSLVAGRLYIWRMALLEVAANPLFGVGLGTFGGTAAVTFGYGRYWVDNFYLQLAAEGGLILLALFIWLLVRAAKGLAAGFVSTTDPFLRALAAGTFAAFIGVAGANFTAGVWETLVVGAGFWFMTGLVSAAALRQAAEGGAAAGGPPRSTGGARGVPREPA